MSRPALDFSKGAQPLYMQILRLERAQILSGAYPFGGQIPTEQALQETYGVSRITVRQAVLALEQEGLVSRVRGRGTVVTYRPKIEELLTSIKSFTDEMRERDMIPGTQSAQIVRTSADDFLAAIFRCKPGAPLFRLERVRTANGKAVVLFITYLSGALPLPMENSRYYGSLYELLLQQGSCPAGIEEKFEACVCGENVARAIGLKAGAPVMKRTRTSFDAQGGVLEYTISYYDASQYSYVIRAGKIPEK